MKKAKSLGMVAGRFWGLLRGPDRLPVLFSYPQDALSNMDTDEYLVEVSVRPAHRSVLLKGEQTLIAEARAKAQAQARPRKPSEEKVRRGSLHVKGAGLLHRSLAEMEPAFLRRLAETMNGSLDVLQGKKKKGAGRGRRAKGVRR